MREMGIRLHSTAIVIHPYSYFQFIVNKISRNKMKTCPRRLTAVELSSVVSDGVDGNGLKLEEISHYFSSFQAVS